MHSVSAGCPVPVTGPVARSVVIIDRGGGDCEGLVLSVAKHLNQADSEANESPPPLAADGALWPQTGDRLLAARD